jgi:hypothetical protein
MVRGPACCVSWLDEISPNELLPTFMLGLALFKMSNRFANWAS